MSYNGPLPQVVNAGGTGLATLTAHDVLVGAGTSNVTLVAPSATSGVPLVSGGASADPSYTTAVVAGGGTGITSTTAYAPICGGTTTTGALQAASTGLSTSGNVLVSKGSSALPQFVATTSVGNWVLIQSQTASSSASLTFTTGISSTYNAYALVCSNVLNGTASQSLWVQISTNGGSSYLSSGYLTGQNVSSYNSATINNVNSASAFLLGALLNTTGQPLCGVYYFQNMTSGNGYPSYSGNVTTCQSSTPHFGYVGGLYNASSTTVNALQVLAASGNIASGTFTLYGILE